MKNKILLLIAFVFFLSGCEVNYELEITNDTYKEKTTILEKNLDNLDLEINGYTNEEMFNEYLKTPIPMYSENTVQSSGTEKLDNVMYYETKDISNDSQTGMVLSASFEDDAINNSQIIHFAYSDFLKGTIDKETILSTSKKLKIFDQYPTLEKVNIIIKTNHKVLENNADKVKNNTYTWVVNEDNYENKSIYLKMSKDKYIDTEGVEISSLVKFLIAFGVLIVGVGFILIFVKIKNKNNNKI